MIPDEALRTAFACLYLRGLPRPFAPSSRRWPEVQSRCRRSWGEVSAREGLTTALRGAGYSLEAAVLESPAWEAAQRVVACGHTVTAAEASYPGRWESVLGHGAPPALWAIGPSDGSCHFACPPASFVSFVGSRSIDERTRRGVGLLASSLAGKGHTIVSGGAPGCDLAAERSALLAGGRVVEVRPCGLDVPWGVRSGGRVLRLAVAAPSEEFSRALAMERNALIYAASPVTVVGAARFKTGGTWHGATEALRRRLGRLLVLSPPKPSQAVRALMGLGAVAVSLDRVLAGDGLAAFEEAKEAPSYQTSFAFAGWTSPCATP